MSARFSPRHNEISVIGRLFLFMFESNQFITSNEKEESKVKLIEGTKEK